MYMYPDVEHAMSAIKDCGEAIRLYGLPAAFCPFSVVVTGWKAFVIFRVWYY